MSFNFVCLIRILANPSIIQIRKLKMAALSLSFLIGILTFINVTKAASTSDFDVNNHHDPTAKTQGRCETVTIPMCRDMPYNETYLPNNLGHATQEEAGYEAHQYYALVKVHCSPALKTFLCALFAPVCNILQRALPPCRSLCETAKAGCEHVLLNFGFGWPDMFECSRFPPNHDLCVNGDIPPGTPPPFDDHALPPAANSPSGNEATKWKFGGGVIYPISVPNKPITNINPAKAFSKELKCPADWMIVDHSIAGELDNCGIPCKTFASSDKKMAAIVVGIVGTITLVSSMFTIITAMLDPSRFQYPERAIVHIAVCYALLAIGYLVGAFWGPEISCHERFVVYGPVSASCSLLFMFVYFCTIASHIWWVLLSMTWFLSAGLKWGGEAIAAYSQYFHLAAWGISAFLAMTTVALGYVEGDPLAGPCALGLQRAPQLQYFMLYPLLVLLSIGTTCIILGFMALFRIRREIKRSATSTSTAGMIPADGQRSLLWDQHQLNTAAVKEGAARLELLMARIGVFSILYTVPAAVFIGSLFYLSTPTSSSGVLSSIIGSPRRNSQTLFIVLLVRYISNMCFGSVLVIWVWSRKTLMTWKSIFCPTRARST